MKKLSGVVISLTLSSVLLTGCGKKMNAVTPAFPEQNLQQVAQTPSYANPDYQQYPQSTQEQYYNPNSPDTNSTDYSNVPNNTNNDYNNVQNGQYQNVNNQNFNNSVPKTVSSTYPATAPSVAPSTPTVKKPWYKKVIEKVKAVFKKKS